MFDSPPRWVRRALRNVVSPIRTPRASSSSRRRGNGDYSRPQSGNVGFVDQTVDLWNDFCKTPEMQILLAAPRRGDDKILARTLFHDDTDHNAVDWTMHLATGCRLFRDLQYEATSNTTALFVPVYMDVLCRLIKVTYYQQNDMVNHFFQESPHQFVLHATVGLSSLDQHLVPSAILDMILITHAQQLQQQDPIHRCLPLAMACENGHCMLLPMLAAYPHAASVPCGSQEEYPLHVACRSGHWQWSTGLRDLFEAAPDVLLTGCHCAFEMAALACAAPSTAEVSSLETLFELLRNNPAALLSFMVVE